MNRKILIGILAVPGIVVAFLQPLISGLLAIVVWIYLMWMIRKRKDDCFNNQMEPKSAERRLKSLKVLLLVAGISFLVFVVSTIVHNVLHGLYDIEETAFFSIALVALLVFVISTAGGLVLFLKGRK